MRYLFIISYITGNPCFLSYNELVGQLVYLFFHVIDGIFYFITELFRFIFDLVAHIFH